MPKKEFIKIWLVGMNTDIDKYSNLYFNEPEKIQDYEFCYSFEVYKQYPIGCIIDICDISDKNGYPENLDDFLREFYKKYP